MMRNEASAFTAMCLAALLCGSCAWQPSPARDPLSNLGVKRSELDVQSLVMKMADDYSVALTDAMRPIIMDQESGPTARQLAQWFQRNGMGSAIDIAVGPNPDAALLDMLVLVSLQRWAFSNHWVSRGIPDTHAQKAAERLRLAEAAAWSSASSVLSESQQKTLRSLIEAWIKANPDRFTVSFVRLDEFVDIRNDQTLSTRADATALLREVAEASAAVDGARLLGERAVWFASRYPFILGQQAETTIYRVADQPEFRSAIEAIDAVKQLSVSLAARVESLDRDLKNQQELLFSKLASERAAAIEQAKAALTEVTRTTAADIDARFAVARDAAVAQTFDRLATERKDFLDDLQSREGALRDIMNELRSTIGTGTALAKELNGTVTAVDQVVARFDQQPVGDRKPLDIKDFRDAAIEATRAAEKLTTLLQETNKVAGSEVWNERIARLDHATTGLIDRAFWRAFVLVLLLLGGLALIRLLPQRTRTSRPPQAAG